MPLFIVERPIRGVQTLMVDAKNKADAKLKVNSFDESVESVSFEVSYYGKAANASIDNAKE